MFSSSSRVVSPRSPNAHSTSPDSAGASNPQPTTPERRSINRAMASPQSPTRIIGLGIDLLEAEGPRPASLSASPRSRILGLYSPVQDPRALFEGRFVSRQSPSGRQSGPAARAFSALLAASPTRNASAMLQRRNDSPSLRHDDVAAQQALSPRVPLGLGAALGLRPRQHFAAPARQLFDDALLDQVREMLAGAESMPCYKAGERFLDDDGGQLTILKGTKLREAPLNSLIPVRIDENLSRDKMDCLLSRLLHEKKVPPLKISRNGEVMDGNHRFALAERLGLVRIGVILEEHYPTPRHPAPRTFARDW